MIELPFFAQMPVAVMGLGRSGLATARALMRSEADVWAWDDDPERRAAAEAKDVPLVDLYRCDWREPVALVLSPGIPHEHPAPHPVAKLARDHGCEITCDVELLGRAMPDASYVGVTGTNGKSTTTALIGHVLQLAGYEVEVGGNLGRPALEFAALPAGGLYVLEMSSYQLERTASITFDIAVLLNLSRDHLERHGGLEGYLAAKRSIFRRQTSWRSAIVGVDDELSAGICRELREAGEQVVVPVSAESAVEEGVYVDDGVLVDDLDGEGVRALDLGEVASLPGRHNWQNAAAAYAACRRIGVPAPAVAASLRSFPGLPHRQEPVAVIDGVAYVNDSKATNADAAAKALACYDRIYWIAGGRAKEGGIDSLAAYFDRVAHAFLIGEAAESFRTALEGHVPVTVSGDLETAVAQAREQALADGHGGAVVLLSPACASFDQFADFEARGDAFRAAVEALPGERGEIGPGGVVPGGMATGGRA